MKKISISRNKTDYELCSHINIGAEEDEDYSWEYLLSLKIHCKECKQTFEFEVMV